jgi:hypothetical protein
MPKPGLERYGIKWGSCKTFKAIPVGFADGTLEGWLRTGTQVTANLATPDGDTPSGETNQLFLVFLCWRPFDCAQDRPCLSSPSLWHRLELLLAPGDLLRDVQGAIASPVLVQVGVTVVAGADDVQVFLSDPLGQTTGTGQVAVPLLVGQKTFHQVKDKLDVRVEIIARRLSPTLQPFVQRLSPSTRLTIGFL